MEQEKIHNNNCLNNEQLEHVAEIIGDGHKVYGIDVESQSLLFDGTLYISDILKTADYIRSLTKE